ncbi:unnamed protein product (macronuclear) [Paramecium tetraurelia]|uniref:Transmembrane protein n=1 Tax=Paramecium tetraurelia TaxID=5888 RepID=A0CPL5_PARTE|nr:uncharacterized protein GSPATT00009124001 [Paramecium tetraurelia]CAK72732.1 unnamed protein product [Paramecium tetraurelia]|eukprot:XP_001440129.1 hypothetical protein (macronuclear) [Paramecium tetraurelia strain d4-2]
MCKWKSNSCQFKRCEEIISVQECYRLKYCFYNSIDQKCQELTDCSMLTAASQTECTDQSMYCGIYNSELKQCQALSIKNCNMYTTQQECQYRSQYQECSWKNQQCQEFDCTVLKSQKECLQYYYICIWVIENQQCIPASCYQKPITDCSFVIGVQNYQFFFQPCLVDYSEGQGKCRDANLSELSPLTCSLNTGNAATWSDKRLDSGSCQECDVYIIKILVITLLMMIL